MSGCDEKENLTSTLETLTIDSLPEVETEVSDEQSEVVLDDVNYDAVKVDSSDTLLDESGNIIDPASLSVFERLKLTAKKLGQTLNDPDKSCKHCFGRGYVGINLDGNIPLPCKCVYKKFFKEHPNWRGQEMPSWNRSTRRRYEKQMGKYINLKGEAMRKRDADIAKSKANLGKNSSNYVNGKKIVSVSASTLEVSEQKD